MQTTVEGLSLEELLLKEMNEDMEPFITEAGGIIGCHPSAPRRVAE